jgi:hypothetical protein
MQPCGARGCGYSSFGLMQFGKSFFKRRDFGALGQPAGFKTLSCGFPFFQPGGGQRNGNLSGFCAGFYHDVPIPELILTLITGPMGQEIEVILLQKRLK